ncbi:ROK family transcriptional regulator [Cohaesibacter celericrescens]|uniref:Sugar kinase n=1 Tax=Cohaesibacter celericrescens TaxID=2067669 RepID=A0A2N5XRK3_9HYPH|nr:ROK family transcriptional regulator [Cohaesibacter celericrescens]PLW77048.1 sugar kinase [Cohaesibacter celericrescens]
MISKFASKIGANAGRSRSHNRQVVLGAIHQAGKIGRAEIARNSGLSTQAVSNIIAQLEQEGMLIEQGRLSTGRGLPSVQYALNSDGGFAFGIEMRPDVIFAALLNLKGATVFSKRANLIDTKPERVIDQVLTLRDEALAATGVAPERVMGAGIVMPGPFGSNGLSDKGTELPDWQHLDASSLFEKALDLPVFVEIDANAAALGERILGAAKGLETYCFLYFGAGLGLGIVTGGRLFNGAFGNAGEIGHILVPAVDSDASIPSSKASSGSVELEKMVSRLSAQRYLGSAGYEVHSGEDLSALYAQDTPALMTWLDRASAPLSHAIATIENLFDPQAIILGGAMPDALLDHLITHIRLSDRSVANRTGRQHPRLLRGSSGRMTATLGAAALVINHALTPQITVPR